MGQKEKKMIAGVSKAAEEEYLAKTLKVVHDNVEDYSREVAKMKEDIDEMLEHYHDNDVEVYTILNNTITLHDHMERALMYNEKAMSKPYFGRIVFHDLALDKEESLYIGRGGIAKDSTHQMVVDWRAPVANAYYENGLGTCSYEVPGGTQIEINLELKRTYEIEKGKLLDYFDSEVIANDDLLTKYLAKNKQAVLGEIIATIQKEQNEIIRRSPYHNIIVQGVAGSGKTTVAMHRISYILYNYAERFKPDDFYIVGSNRILLDYITGVLPDLDVYGIRQMTMEQLFVRLLYEDWDKDKYKILDIGVDGEQGSVRGTLGWFRDLEDFCGKLEMEVIPKESVYLNPRQFVEGIRDGKAGVHDETVKDLRNGKGDAHDGPIREQEDLKGIINLLSREAIEDYIDQNPGISIQSKINMLNERLLVKIKDEFTGKALKYTESERKAIIKAYRGRFGAKVWKRLIYTLYQDFLLQQKEKGYKVQIPDKGFDVYDLAALAYLYKRVKETEVISEAHHVVIDEAQDYGMMAYSVLKFCIKDCTYTVMGDVSQNIHFGYGLSDWEELKGLMLSGARDSFGVLKKSYRNTVEISEFATNILHHGSFSQYPVEPIIRHGQPVQVKKGADRRAMLAQARKICAGWQEKGLDTIAVICRDKEKARAVAEDLGRLLNVRESDLEKMVFDSGVMVLPVDYTKGLEFDAVLIWDPVREDYPVDDGHAKLLYVAATRALHELCILHCGDLTGLIADPIPQNALSAVAIKSADVASKEAATVSAGAGAWGTAPVAGRSGNSTPADVRPKLPKASIPRRPSAVTASVRLSSDKRPFIPAGNEPRSHFPAKKVKPYKAVEDTGTSAAASTASGHREIPVGRPDFGDMPPTEKLRPAGHSKINLSIRWVEKGADGLYLQSRYGTLRLSPIGSTVIRVSFAKGKRPDGEVNPQIGARRTDHLWMYKNSSQAVELVTDEICLCVDKASGAIRYQGRDKRLLLAEREKECRQIEEGYSGGMSWLFLNWRKGENLYALGPKGKNGQNLRGTARYISSASGELPFLLSDNGYGLLLATDSPVICSDISAYGSYISMEDTQIDYYFIAGKKQSEIMSAYTSLCRHV